MKLTEVPIVSRRPAGYRTLGYAVEGKETDKAACFDYYGHQVWIPKKTLRFVEGRYHAPFWAIETSKDFQQGMR